MFGVVCTETGESVKTTQVPRLGLGQQRGNCGAMECVGIGRTLSRGKGRGQEKGLKSTTLLPNNNTYSVL